MIKLFHFQLKAGVFEDYANGYPVGEYKNRANQVSDLVTTSPQLISEKAESLLQNYASGKMELMDIVKFHSEYEKIHPFQDGNGRTGRAIILKQCLDNNMVPVIISDDNKLQYYHALHEAQTQENFVSLYSFFQQAQETYYENVKEYILPLKKEQKKQVFRKTEPTTSN